jgi:hypothetical protein
MRKRTVRKVWAKVNPIEHAISGATITPRHLLDKLLVRELASLDDFTHGRAHINQWADMSRVVNLCETMARDGIGAEALDAFQKAQETLLEAAVRFEKTGRMGLSGLGIQALRDCIEYHDLQRSSIHRSEYERLIKLTAARVKGGHNVVDVNERAAT